MQASKLRYFENFAHRLIERHNGLECRAACAPNKKQRISLTICMVAFSAGVFVDLDNAVKGSENMFAGDQGSRAPATLRWIICISANPGHPNQEYAYLL